MANIATFSADFGPFERALAAAKESLTSFEVTGKGVAQSLERLARSFSGGPIIAEAQKLAAAVEAVGGASRLTAKEQERVNATVTEAIAKYRALGQQAPEALERLARETSQAGSSMGRLGELAAGVFSGQALWAGAQRSLGTLRDLTVGLVELADQFDDLAVRTGLSRAAIQEFAYAAQQTGTSLDAVVRGAEILSRQLVEGDRQTVLAIQDLGLSLETLRQLAPTEVLTQVAEAISELPTPAERSAMAMQLLGRGAGELVPLLLNLQDLREEARRLGLVMSDDLVRSGGDLMDAWTALKGAGQGLLVETLEPMVPVLNAFAQRIRAGVAEAREAGPVWRTLSAAWRDSIPVVGALSSGLEQLGSMLWALGPVMTQIPPPSPLRAWREAIEARALVPPSATDALETLQRELKQAGEAAAQSAKRTQAMRAELDALTGAETIRRANALVEQLTKLGDPARLSPEQFTRVRDTMTAALEAAHRLGVEVNREWEAWIQRVAVLTYRLRAELAPALESIQDLAIPPLPSRDLPDPFGMRTPSAESTPIGEGASAWDRIASGLNSAQTILGILGMLGISTGSAPGRILGGAATGAAVGSATSSLLSSFGLAAVPALGPIGAILGSGLGLASLFRSEESRVVNPARDRFLAQFGGPGTGEGSGFLTLAQTLAKLPTTFGGGEGGGFLFQQLIGAKTQRQYEQAQAAIESALARYNALLTEQASLEEQLAALREQATPKWKDLEAAANRYGIALESLGQPIQQLRHTELATQMLSDIEQLIKAGGDVGSILFGMKEEISAIVQESIKFGTKIPENMRPYIEELIRAGLLVDEHGNKIEDVSQIQWGEPVKTQAEIINEAMERLIARLEEIADILAGRLPKAAEEGVEGVDRVIRGYDPPEIVVPVRAGSPDSGEGFQGGTRGLRDFGAGTLAVLHGREAVVTEAEWEAMRQRRASPAIEITVPVVLDGYEIARSTAKWQATVLSLYGI